MTAIKLDQQLKEEISKAVENLFPDQKISSEDVSLEHPNLEEYGDFSSSVALKLAKDVKENPVEVANKIVQKLDQSSLKNVIFEKVAVAGPGFVNFFLSTKFLQQQVAKIQTSGGDYGKGDAFRGKKVMLEFTDPNPFKEFHIGHVYTNTVGESLARIFESQNADVWRVCYQGDVGLHVAKAIWGILQGENLQKFNDYLNASNAQEFTPFNKANFLGQVYAVGATKYETDPSAKTEIEQLNKKIYERSDETVNQIYDAGRKWSLDYFEGVYKLLGMKARSAGKAFDRYYYESEVGLTGLALVKNHLKDGIFVESQGAVIFPGEQYGLHNRVFINSAGLPTYEAKEMGLAPTKYEDFKYDLSFIITGNEINEYFKVLLKVLSLINPDLAEKTKHIGHGMVRLPEGKMSSRTGKVITGQWLIDETSRVAQGRFEESKVRAQGEDREKMVNKSDLMAIAVGAIKYAFLRSAIGGNIEFDFDRSLSLEGDSGPYVQYSYARAKSILRKAVEKGLKGESGELSSNLAKEELEILRYLYRFPEVTEQAARQIAPNFIASYLFELAKRFNAFYNQVPVLAGEKTEISFRLALVEAVSQVLKNGLELLGIDALEKM